MPLLAEYHNYFKSLNFKKSNRDYISKVNQPKAKKYPKQENPATIRKLCIKHIDDWTGRHRPSNNMISGQLA